MTNKEISTDQSLTIHFENSDGNEYKIHASKIKIIDTGDEDTLYFVGWRDMEQDL